MLSFWCHDIILYSIIVGENDFYHAPTGGVAVMPTVTTIVRGNGREEGELDSGLSQVRPPPPPVPPPMASKITG